MPSSPLNIAVVGLGFMGVTHLKGWRNIPEVRLHAVVDADARRLTGDLSSVGGNMGATGEQFDFSEVRGYRSLDEALADPAIDAVDICLPTDQHVPAATAALRAGKHVLTEKPISLDVASAEALIREAESNGRILMAAHVLRSFFLPTRNSANRYVKILPFAPRSFAAVARRPYGVRGCEIRARSGGGILDLLIHDVDFCISLWGMPESVHARGYADLPHGIDVIHADLTYPGLGPVVISGGWHHPNSYPFSMEFTVTTDAATFEWSSTANDFRQYGEDGGARSIPLEEKDPFTAELSYFAGCVASGAQPERCPPTQSAQAVALMRQMLESREKNGGSYPC